MTDAARRALRTWLQAFLGSLITSGVLSGVETDGVVDWAIAEKAVIAALAAGVIALLTWAQNALEDTTQFPAVLKAPASEGVNPVPDEGGHADVSLVTCIACVVSAVVLVAWAFDSGPFS